MVSNRQDLLTCHSHDREENRGFLTVRIVVHCIYIRSLQALWGTSREICYRLSDCLLELSGGS